MIWVGQVGTVRPVTWWEWGSGGMRPQRWWGVGPRGCKRRVRAGIFCWLYSGVRSRCDNHRRQEGSHVGTDLDMQRGVAEVGDGNAHRARAARQCMHVEERGRPLARSGRAGRQHASVSTNKNWSSGRRTCQQLTPSSEGLGFDSACPPIARDHLA